MRIRAGQRLADLVGDAVNDRPCPSAVNRVMLLKQENTGHAKNHRCPCPAS